MRRLVSTGLRFFCLSVLLPAVFLALAGCSSPDVENQAYRPWGAPQSGWESGLPSSLTEGR